MQRERVGPWLTRRCITTRGSAFVGRDFARAIVIAVMMTAIVTNLQFALEENAPAPVRQHTVSHGGPQFVARVAQEGFELGRISRFDYFELITLR